MCALNEAKGMVLNMEIVSLSNVDECNKGLEYYRLNIVKKVKKVGIYEYTSVVSGREDYRVYLNLKDLSTSSCNCSLYKEKNILCKHIVATYFEVVPNSVTEYENEFLK